MSTAKRRINSTGRKRITREAIDIRMIETRHGEPLRARASLDLRQYAFPGDAILSIEAYHRSSGMRFDCGTIAAPAIPEELVLNEVDQTGSVLFRVKVVDPVDAPGRLLGSAERIAPRSEEDQEGRRSLFPILYRKLGQEVWRVELEYGGRPKLILNSEIPGIRQKLDESALLRGMLLPAAFRIVLEKLVEEPDEDDDEEPGWKSEWLQYCRDSLGISTAPDDLEADAHQEWIDDAVIAFCETHRFVEGIRKGEAESN